MFGEQFYPTPTKLIQRMLKPYERTGEVRRYETYAFPEGWILDPSAGKGDILDYIEGFTRGCRELRAIEIDSNLCAVLADKGHSVIDRDFLSYSGTYQFGLIVMNPPFNNGVDHLLHAWDISKGGDIVCLLNAETIRNPHTSKRKLLAKIIEDNDGSVEYIEDAFKDAERSTNVEIVLVRLHKPNSNDDDIFSSKAFDGVGFEFTEESIQDQVAMADVFMRYENAYNATLEAYQDYYKAWHRLNYYACACLGQDQGVESIDHPNIFADTFTKRAWSILLKESKFTSRLTRKVHDEFMTKFASQKTYAFTKANMVEMFNVLWGGRQDLMNQGLLQAFDKFTRYHEENRVHIEGWKTNDAYKVGPKVIFPHGVKSYIGDWVDHAFLWEFKDIEMTLCHLLGIHFDTKDDTLLFNRLDQSIRDHATGKWHDSKFFAFKHFKKGSLHLKWNDPVHLQVFNERCCELRGFPLPGNTEKRQREHSKRPQKSNKPPQDLFSSTAVVQHDSI